MFQLLITHGGNGAFAGSVPYKVRPRSRFTGAAQVDEQTGPVHLLPPWYNDLGAQIKWFHVDLEHKIELLLGDFVRRRCIMDHACTIHHDVKTVIEETARRGEDLAPRRLESNVRCTGMAGGVRAA